MAIKNSDRAAFWQKHLADFRASGLSRGDYCSQHGLKVHQLAYQLKRFGKPPKMPAKSSFARVALPKEPPQRHGLRLVFGRGVALELTSGADADWIAKVIAAVGGVP